MRVKLRLGEQFTESFDAAVAFIIAHHTTSRSFDQSRQNQAATDEREDGASASHRSCPAALPALLRL